MTDTIGPFLETLEQYTYVYTLGLLALLVTIAAIANWATRRILLRHINRVLGRVGLANEPISSLNGLITHLSRVIPALILTTSIQWVPNLPSGVIKVIENVTGAFIVLTIALAFGSVLNLVISMYQRRPDAQRRPIKSYVQLVKLIIYVLATILIIANLVDRSPLILLSGLGALAAVLMLIFQDTILSLVASVQLTSNDMVRVGDWIEMPQLNADGDVIDIALHTVKVQNWDKTITTIPTKRMITDSFRNWRGMQDSGGRRIKRSIYIDQQSVRFLSDDDIAQLSKIKLLTDYLANKQAEIAQWNRETNASDHDINARQLTNIGTFRAYVIAYLRQHSGIHQGMTQLVRQLHPTADGLPLELYCFTSTIAWAPYESIQSDIFDHLLSAIPVFGLRVFQRPSGADVLTVGQHLKAS